MSHGPSLIFDKSSLESLNLDEAVLLDNFYRSTITPLSFVECLADLEKTLQALALLNHRLDRWRTAPRITVNANVHHVRILKGELPGVVRMEKVHGRPMIDYGQRVQLKPSKDGPNVNSWRSRETSQSSGDVC